MNSSPQLTGAEILWATLVGEGTTTVFGYPRRRHLAHLRRPCAKFPVHHVPRPPTSRGASHMADGLRPRLRPCRRLHGDQRPPAATNLVTGIATAMLDRHSGCPPSPARSRPKSSVRTPSRKSTSTGITLPITKHNFLVTRAEDIAPTVPACLLRSPAPAAPAPVLVDITKDAQQATARLRLRKAAAPRPHPRPFPCSPALTHCEPRAQASPQTSSSTRNAPIILAGHGIVESGAQAKSPRFRRVARHPHCQHPCSGPRRPSPPRIRFLSA